jgi:prepilin-type N-terminal cleavage/methylation domain-containing protein
MGRVIVNGAGCTVQGAVLEEMTMTANSTRAEAGFSLIETMIAMAILATGLLSLAGVFVLGLNHLSYSSAALIAREKAREAVESVHTARDTRVIAWCEIRNESAPSNCPDDGHGVFKDGPQPLRNAGPDGLVNTGDDEGVEEALGPGPDNLLGTSDDVRTPLDSYTREIAISDVMLPSGQPNPSLRRLVVRIRYGKMNSERIPEREYVLSTFISSIS